MRTFLISVAAEMVPLSAHDRSAATSMDDLRDGPERAGAVDGGEDEPAEPSVLAAFHVDHAGEADELRRGPADAEGAVLGGLEDELVGPWRADGEPKRCVRYTPTSPARAPASA